MITLWYWIEGAPKDRPGGPWWHRQFDSKAEADTFLSDISSFLHAYAWDEGHVCLEHCQTCYPPLSVKVIH